MGEIKKLRITRIIDSPLDDDFETEPTNGDMEIMSRLLALSTNKPTTDKKKKKKKKKDKKKKEKGERLNFDDLNIFEEEKDVQLDKEAEDFYEKRYNGSLVLLSNLMQEVNSDRTLSKKYLKDMMIGRIKASPMSISTQMSNNSSLLNTKLSIIKEINAVNTKISDLELKKKSTDIRDGKGKDGVDVNKKQIMDSIFDKLMNVDELPSDYDNLSDDSKVKRKKTSQMDIDERIKELESNGSLEFNENELAFKYENDSVDIVIEKNRNNGHWQFAAIDDEGNELLDYPLPSKRSVGSIQIDEEKLIAKDKLGNVYDVHLVNSFTHGLDELDGPGDEDDYNYYEDEDSEDE